MKTGVSTVASVSDARRRARNRRQRLNNSAAGPYSTTAPLSPARYPPSASRSSATEKRLGDDSHRSEVRHDDLIVGQPAPERLLDVPDEVKDVDRIDELAFEEGGVDVKHGPFLLEQPAPDKVEKLIAAWIRHGAPILSSGSTPPPGRSTHGYPAAVGRR